jgi:hypothetical protein
MQTIKLRGLAEGILGASSVQAINMEEVFANHSALAAVRQKLEIKKNCISGFAACDG